MPMIRIRVGASIDGSLKNVFKSVEAAVKQSETAKTQAVGAGTTARKAYVKSEAQVQREAAKDAAAAAKAAAKEAAAAKIAAGKSAGDELRRQWAAEDAAAKKATLSTKEFLGVMKQIREETKRSFAGNKAGFNSGAKDAERLIDQEHARQRRIRSTSHRGTADMVGGVAAFAGNTLREGAGLALDIARGTGLNTDLASHARANADLQKRAVDLSNSSYQPNQLGPNSIRQDPRALERFAREQAGATSSDPIAAMEGLQEFTKKTGDLETGKQVFGELSRLAKATGTDLNDMMSAAAEAANQIRPSAEKTKNIVSTMTALAQQGKIASVEISDLAAQLAKVAASAPQIAGDRATAIVTLGALAQESRSHGGSASASQAATSANSFVRDLVKPTNLKKFTKAGIDVFSDKSHTTVKDPQEIILEALKKTHGATDKLANLFPNSMSMRVVKGFQSIYNDAGGGEKGLQAVRDEFASLTKAIMTEKEITDSFNAAMRTSESQMQRMNNEFSQATSELTAALIPAFVALTPILKDAANDIAIFAKGLTGNDPDKTGKQSADVNEVASIAKRRAYKAIREGKATPDDIKMLETAQQHLHEAGADKLKENQSKESSILRTMAPTVAGAVFGPLAPSGMKTATRLDNAADIESSKTTKKNEVEVSELLKQLIEINKTNTEAAQTTAKNTKPKGAPSPVNQTGRSPGTSPPGSTR